MSSIATAIVGSAVVGAVASNAAAKKGSKAAASAADAQSASAQAGIEEQSRQFDAVRSLLNPYVQAGSGNFNGTQYLAANPDVAADPYYSQHPDEHFQDYGRIEGREGAGTGSLFAQQSLLGLNGNDSQQRSIDGIRNSAGFTSALAQGENSIRQNASATGGLRGGNIQGALAQFSPQLLAQQIQQQYANLGGITSMGQNAAAGVGNAGMATGNNISNLLQQQGAAQAGGVLGSANAYAQGMNGIGRAAGFVGANWTGFGGTGTPVGITGGSVGFGAGTASSGFGSQFSNPAVF